ncbi:L-iditol 2-dehydrogenase [Balneatrix alpica]|uniref:L-iditol 2-dehydrogenase n=1 Tax=Balneatrix alpica TaxID=75684 RepID=A0ABV5ZIH8_9GAMM|nr:L-iditol 2-dehydrogenase [Balneatrix alpica]
MTPQPALSLTSFSLTGKRALLTGAGGGIGLAVARTYLEAGAHCLLCDLLAEANAEVQSLLNSYPQRCHYFGADLSQLAQIEQLVEYGCELLGGIDILFNNAAIFDMAPLLESDEAMYERLFAVNVKGCFFTLQKVAAQMVKQGQGGSIINLASQAGRRGEALVSHYCASKAAVISYTQSAALALAGEQIRVNGIAPGVVDTPMWHQVDALFARYEGLPLGEKKRQVGLAVPLGRMGRPADLCGLALFLAADASAYVTAQTYNVDGGNVMS